jgi:hypothetical protein
MKKNKKETSMIYMSGKNIRKWQNVEIRPHCWVVSVTSFSFAWTCIQGEYKIE